MDMGSEEQPERREIIIAMKIVRFIIPLFRVYAGRREQTIDNSEWDLTVPIAAANLVQGPLLPVACLIHLCA